MATVQVAGPFNILASPLWIKGKDRECAVTGEQISSISVKAGSSDPNAAIEHIIDGSGIKDRDNDGLLEHSTTLNDMWLSGSGQLAGWIEFDLGAVYKLDLIKVWNFNVEQRTNTGVKKADISIWTEDKGWQKIHDDVELLEAEGNDDYDEPTLVKLNGVEAGKVRFDDLANLGDTNFMGLSEVRFFEVRGPKALRPQPADGSMDVGVTDLSLKWVPGLDATTHNLYFGTEPNNIKLLGTVKNASSAKLSRLATDNTYLWRIDEVRADGSVVIGDLWSFTTCGLIGWWKFDEIEGTAAGDSSGNSYNGTLVGDPQWRPSAGKVDGALEFDSDGDYVKIEDESSFDIASQITVAAWVNITSVPTEWTAIVTKGDSAWRLSTERAERQFHFAIGNNTLLAGQRIVSANEWHHVTGVYDGSQMRLYVDGKLDASESYSESVEQNDYPVYIGENAEQTGRFWHGLIDDVRIYNYALSESDVATLYSGKELPAATEVTIEKAAAELKPEEEQISISRGRRAVLVVGIVAAIAIGLIISRKKTTV